jgi:hypothetical protein
VICGGGHGLRNLPLLCEHFVETSKYLEDNEAGRSRVPASALA